MLLMWHAYTIMSIYIYVYYIYIYCSFDIFSWIFPHHASVLYSPVLYACYWTLEVACVASKINENCIVTGWENFQRSNKSLITLVVQYGNDILLSRHIFTRLRLVEIFCVLIKYFPILYSDSCYKYYIYIYIYIYNIYYSTHFPTAIKISMVNSSIATEN